MIEKYIKDLLFFNDFLIISGLGGFVCSYSCSELSISKNKITPPTKNIVFNTKLISNDQLLTNHISSQESISLEEADEKVRLFVVSLLDNLKSNNQFIIEELGRFYNDVENHLRFEQYAKFNYLIESFGLRDLYFKSIDRTPKNKQIFNTLNQKFMADNLQVDKMEEENSDEIVVDNDEDSDEFVEKGGVNNSSAVLYSIVAVSVFIFVVFTTYYLNMDKNTYAVGSFNPMAIFNTNPSTVAENKLLPTESETQPENISNEPIANEESDLNSDNVNQQPEQQVEESRTLSISPSTEESNLNITDAITSKTGRFYIIAGSFKKTVKAIALKEKLISEGQTPNVISSGIDGQILRVSVADFETYQEATSKKNELLSTYGDQLWVLNY